MSDVIDHYRFFAYMNACNKVPHSPYSRGDNYYLATLVYGVYKRTRKWRVILFNEMSAQSPVTTTASYTH